MTLKEIADFVAGRMGDPFNDILKEQIKFAAKIGAATLIKQDMDRHGASGLYLQRIVLPVKKVDVVDSCVIEAGCPVLRTVNKVPRPIRRNSDSDFEFVGSPDGRLAYSPTNLELVGFNKHLKFTKNFIRYEWINQYIYIFNAKRIEVIGVKLSSTEIIKLCDTDNNNCYVDDMEFLLPEDLLKTLITDLLSGLFQNPTENQTVDTNEQITQVPRKQS